MTLFINVGGEIILHTLLDSYSLPRARSPRQRPKSSQQRAIGKEALGKEFFAESHVAGSRQRLCRRPETLSAKPTALSRNVNVDVVFAESRADRLSAKTIYFFKKSLCREPVRLALGKGVFAESHTGRRSAKTYRQALGKDFLFFLKKISAEPPLHGEVSETCKKNRQHIYDTKATHPSKF